MVPHQASSKTATRRLFLMHVWRSTEEETRGESFYCFEVMAVEIHRPQAQRQGSKE